VCEREVRKKKNLEFPGSSTSKKADKEKRQAGPQEKGTEGSSTKDSFVNAKDGGRGRTPRSSSEGKVEKKNLIRKRNSDRTDCKKKKGKETQRSACCGRASGKKKGRERSVPH